jgi:choice-of-anchor A domain-containing protein
MSMDEVPDGAAGEATASVAEALTIYDTVTRFPTNSAGATEVDICYMGYDSVGNATNLAAEWTLVKSTLAQWEAPSSLKFVDNGKCDSEGSLDELKPAGSREGYLTIALTDGHDGGDCAAGYKSRGGATTGRGGLADVFQCELGVGGTTKNSEYITLHEVGHGLGMMHEHKRGVRDATGKLVHIPEVCYDIVQAYLADPTNGNLTPEEGDYWVTAYDPLSVLNYCAPRPNVLTALDRLGIEMTYPKPDPLPVVCSHGCIKRANGSLVLRENGLFTNDWQARGGDALAVYIVDGWGAMWGKGGFSAQNVDPGTYSVRYSLFDAWGGEWDSETATVIVDDDLYLQTLLSTGALRSVGHFSAYSFGDIDGIKDFRGPIAAKGSVDLNNVSINLESPAGVAVRARVDVSLTNGSASGDVQYAGDLNTNQTFGFINGGSFDSFAGDGSYQQHFYLVETNISNISDGLAHQPATGTVGGAWGEIILTGYEDVNVYRLTQEEIANSWSIKINSTPSSTVIIDVVGDAPYVHGTIALKGISSERVLWNFNGANTLDIAYVDFKGSALAPYADADVRGGAFIGGLFSANVTGSAVGFLWAPYEGEIPDCIPLKCGDLGANCGTASDGCGGTVSCGTCTGVATCGGGGVPNVCGCTRTTCAAEGANCGYIDTGCGGVMYCGTCPGSQTCGGGGIDNVCAGGGACDAVQAWDASQNWTEYSAGDQREHNRNLWECHTPSWCYLEPGGANSSLGWNDLGGC